MNTQQTNNNSILCEYCRNYFLVGNNEKVIFDKCIISQQTGLFNNAGLLLSQNPYCSFLDEIQETPCEDKNNN